MLVFNKENSVSDYSALREAILELTFYDYSDHPEKDPDIDPLAGGARLTKELSNETGIIKASINEMVELIETNLEITIDDYQAYGQYYMSTNTVIYRDYTTGFLPKYWPEYVAILYIGHDGWDSTLEFWNSEKYVDTYPSNLEHSINLTQNDFAIFNHALAHRIVPSEASTNAGVVGNLKHAGLMLAMFFNTT